MPFFKSLTPESSCLVKPVNNTTFAGILIPTANVSVANKTLINIFENNALGLDDYEVEFLSKTNKMIDKIEMADDS